MFYEIKKGDTTLDITKEKNGNITIENSYQDTMDLVSVPINLTKEEVLQLITKLIEFTDT